jgi:hypothetical protein
VLYIGEERKGGEKKMNVNINLNVDVAQIIKWAIILFVFVHTLIVV